MPHTGAQGRKNKRDSIYVIAPTTLTKINKCAKLITSCPLPHLTISRELSHSGQYPNRDKAEKCPHEELADIISDDTNHQEHPMLSVQYRVSKMANILSLEDGSSRVVAIPELEVILLPTSGHLEGCVRTRCHTSHTPSCTGVHLIVTTVMTSQERTQSCYLTFSSSGGQKHRSPLSVHVIITLWMA